MLFRRRGATGKLEYQSLSLYFIPAGLQLFRSLVLPLTEATRFFLDSISGREERQEDNRRPNSFTGNLNPTWIFYNGINLRDKHVLYRKIKMTVSF